ncbi:MAG: 3-dehydroquinate dehydratase [Erysipelotrichaceae bacterium]|jgi:3-dehydroquinate dehydratase-2|nr:3-dehydroquinate dehydratase [Erysipelotrichaceae bacterium]
MTKTIWVLDGPNLNFLGIREPEVYGNRSYQDLKDTLQAYCANKNIALVHRQSNHEGQLVDWIQEAYYQKADGLILNAGAYTHTSIALYDALMAIGIACVEVHLSDPKKREDFRKTSYLSSACVKTISGLGFESYLKAIDFLYERSSV